MSVGMFSSFRDAMRRQHVSFAARTEMMKARLRSNSLGAEEDPALRYEEYTCFYLCGDCGHLEQEDMACSVCGGGCIDLRNSPATRYLQDAEETERRETPALVVFLSRLLSLGIFVGLSWSWLFAMELGIFPLWKTLFLAPFLLQVVGFTFLFVLIVGASPVFLIPGVSLFLAKEARKPMSRVYHKLRAMWSKERPRRWFGAMQGDVEAQASSLFQGRAHTEEPLLSPLTRRPCLAYRVEAFLRDPLSTKEQVWMLDEKKSCSFEVGGHVIDGEKVVPCLETKEIQWKDSPLSEEELHIFLRQRGLFWEDGDYLLREAIIPVHTAISVRQLSLSSEEDAQRRSVPFWALSSL
ncbi:MAG: hypothetical protein H6728_04580 [Myxococcales bacterium]|nr:hypothetical protein [Myxococcales bacterium]MCB9642329.1 hypothetical protein [Myxococcales bacterium]